LFCMMAWGGHWSNFLRAGTLRLYCEHAGQLSQCVSLNNLYRRRNLFFLSAETVSGLSNGSGRFPINSRVRWALRETVRLKDLFSFITSFSTRNKSFIYCHALGLSDQLGSGRLPTNAFESLGRGCNCKETMGGCGLQDHSVLCKWIVSH
jgi:hypothetical protein